MIYTKKGDDGTTSLVGGTRVKKCDIRVKVYGEIDGLISLLGYVSTLMHHSNYEGEIFVIQNKLFEIESMVACEDEKTLQRVAQISEFDVAYLERKIDTMTVDLPELTGFIIPSSSQTATLIHVCRTWTRRCERLLIECNEIYPQPTVILHYMNRLSDYFFVLARTIMRNKHRTEKFWKRPENS